MLAVKKVKVLHFQQVSMKSDMQTIFEKISRNYRIIKTGKEL